MTSVATGAEVDIERVSRTDDDARMLDPARSGTPSTGVRLVASTNDDPPPRRWSAA
jgi:hypothetical protein